MGNIANKALSLKAVPKRNSFKALSLNRENKSVNDVRALASYLCDKFNDEQSMNFYLKCAWHLPKDFLVDLADRASNKNNPKRYFLSVAHREMNG